MTISTRTADGRRQLRDRFREVLLSAAKHRHEREHTVETEDGPELAWKIYELNQLRAAVNIERGARGLPPATREQIRNADSQAGGHVDYANKIALYCAEIAMGIERTAY